MKIKIKGKGEVCLNDNNDFVFQGGEGRVYAKGQTVYKIYLDINKVIPEGKIRELRALNKDNIVRPEDIILDPDNNRIIGYTMKLVENAEPVCKLFSNSFRDRNAVTPESTVRLVENLRDGIDFVHRMNCLLIDMNENNFLIDAKDWLIPYFIDVDSYQTPSYPATAIMPSIRDYHTHGYSMLTDWYSFGILSFQLFAGIHPYKGKHPDYSQHDLIKRMKDGISVFDKKVTLPKAARDFSLIPTEYMKWYEALFAGNKRIAPPAAAGFINVIPVLFVFNESTKNFTISLERDYTDRIISFREHRGRKVCMTKNNIFVNHAEYKGIKDANIIFAPDDAEPVAASIRNGCLVMSKLKDGSGLKGACINADAKFVIDNTLYVRHREKLMEIILMEINGNIIFSVRDSWNIMPKATSVFDGVLAQNMLGHAYLTIPVPARKWCVTKAVKELDGVRIIDAKAENRVAAIAGVSSDKCNMHIFRFDERFEKYDCRIIENSGADINFTVLPNGLVLMITDDGELEMFMNNPDKREIKKVKDPEIAGDMRLCRDGSRVMFFRNNKLFQLSTKPAQEL